QETAALDNPYLTQTARCHGFDVYGQMLGQAKWIDMLFLLFAGEAPSAAQARVLEDLAVALANPGPREASVHAAMCGGVAGSPAAACLMAALAVGAGKVGGGREVFLAMSAWQAAGANTATLVREFAASTQTGLEVWPQTDQWPGFEPHNQHAALPVRQTLARLALHSPGQALPYLAAQHTVLEARCGHGLALSGVAAAAFHDIGMSPAQGEMLHLLLRLPGAAAHALEQRETGYKNFPFGSIDLQNDPDAADAIHANSIQA
ncbi:MAG TPA: hypothetical protein VFW00_01675, partial [Rhodocyclaceae bacterium]|nr:hypothetical protein [Rhodocyclaceae bacterium]